jgi:prepilin-type processing-associated H-X9-DG protein
MINEIRASTRATDPRGAWAWPYTGGSITSGNAVGDCNRPNNGYNNEFGVFNTARAMVGCDDVQFASSDPANGLGVGSSSNSSQGQARSSHGGGVNACFCDGSVRWIGNDVYPLVWYYMLSRNDGTPWNY